MKTTLTILAAALLLTSSVAFAEEPAGAPPAGAPPAHEGKGPGGEGRRERPQLTEEQKKEMFPKKKAEILARMKERQACVEKSTDMDSLHDCMPKFGKNGGKGGWGRRGGGEGGGDRKGPPGGEGPGGEE